MKRGTFIPALFVIVLITFDISLSIAHAKTKITIYKVANVTSGKNLRLRAWPSPKSRIKVSLPYNAKDIIATGKKKKLGRTQWLEVFWNKNKGWVNAKYLKKTGVLLKTAIKSDVTSPIKEKHIAKSRNKATKINSSTKRKISSRNTRSIKSKNIPIEMPPQEFGGDRYDQTLEMNAKEVKTAYAPKNKSSHKLICNGISPKPWNMKMSVSGNTMNITFLGKPSLKVPLRYNDWTSNNKVRMSLGGDRGRNSVIDVNLERTNACRVGSSKKRYRYEIKTTINNSFYSGCCR